MDCLLILLFLVHFFFFLSPLVLRIEPRPSYVLEPHLHRYPVKLSLFQSPNLQQTSASIAFALRVNVRVAERGGSQVSQ